MEVNSLKNYFQEELKRAFISKSTGFSILIILLCLIIGAIESYLFPDPNNNAFNLLITGYSGGTASVLSIIFPVLVSIPFASSYVTDMQTGYLKYVFTKMETWKYIVIRLLVNGLVGGFVLSFSLLIAFIVFVLLKGTHSTTVNSQLLVFANIFVNYPFVYILLMILNAFLCGLVFSTFALGFSSLLKNKYLSILFPFLFYIFSGTVLIKFNHLLHGAITYSLTFVNSSYSTVLSYDMVLLTIGIITFMLGVQKNAEENF